MNECRRYLFLEDKDISLILELRGKGKTYREIAIFFGIDPATVKRYCAALKMGWTAEEITFIREKYKAGWKISDLAKHFDCDRRRVGAVMRINGINTSGRVRKRPPNSAEMKASYERERKRVEIIMETKKYRF